MLVKILKTERFILGYFDKKWLNQIGQQNGNPSIKLFLNNRKSNNNQHSISIIIQHSIININYNSRYNPGLLTPFRNLF